MNRYARIAAELRSLDRPGGAAEKSRAGTIRPSRVAFAVAVWVCLLVAVSACDGSVQPTAALNADPNSPDNAGATPLPTMTALALASQLVATPTPTTTPGLSPATPTRPPPSTFTPVPVLPMRITADLEPPTPRAATDFLLQLTVANDGERPAHGVYVATSGPWERWTVVEILPSGMFGRDAAGSHIVSPIEISPHESRLVEVRIRADEPSEEQLTFAVREAEPGDIR